MHALIIEDDVLIALAIEASLSECGFTSFALAASEERAVAAARERHPDLITADIRLRPGDGIAAVRRIFAERPVPVIYVTASADQLAGIPRALIVGKPFSDRMIATAVETARSAFRAENRPRPDSGLLVGEAPE